MNRLVLVGLVAVVLHLGGVAGCAFQPVGQAGPPTGSRDAGARCQAGTTEECGCLNGEIGTQACGPDGRYGACSCDEVCVPGRSEQCTCADGRLGARRCADEGVFGPCSCVGSGPDAGGGPPTGADAGRPGLDAAAPGPDAGSSGGTVLASGTDTLVDLFPASSGLVVVRKTGIDLLDASGGVLATVASPRDITAAAFDGTLLGVADKAMLTVYDTSLASLRSVALTESCASAVMVSGARFVCGPEGDWDRVFVTYDLQTGAKLASSTPVTYEGIPMRRVPGTDDFVTVTTGLSPSDFYLHRVGADHKVVSYGDSPYHGDFSATTAYAFDATPATHLVQNNGIFLRIYTTACEANQGGWSNGCFERDGELGTLGDAESFAAMTDDGAGTIYALVWSGGWYSDGLCKDGCKVQRIDVAGRLVTGEAAMKMTDGAAVAAAKWDPVQKRFLVGYLQSKDPYSYGQYAGFQVLAFSFP